MESAPSVIVGAGVTSISKVSEIHPVEVSVKTKLPVPAETPVTNPAFVTVAMAGKTSSQVPPVVGVNVVVDPIHTSGVPLTVTVGLGLTVTAGVVALQPVAVLVKVKVAEP